MAAVPAEVHGPSDAELITSVRGGQLDAYGALYERHVGAAYNLARQLSRSSAEADDLVSEAFAKVLDTLRTGRGPDSAFRAYLLTALRHVAYDKTRRDRRLELADDVTTVSGVSTEKVSVPFRDTAVAGLERSLAAKAFARLPERWQAVLWHTEIEGQSPAEVAPLLGLTANGVSALAYRAREGLRQAYLQVHLAETTADRCRATVDKLGAWTRGGLSKRETAQVEAHLDTCDDCRALAAELREVNSALVLYIAPLVLGAGAAGYLALTAGAKAAAAGTVAAVGASAGAGAAAAGSSGAGGAAGAASSVPRQFLGVGASVAALAAALAIALTSGSGQPAPAIAAPPPAPTRTAAPPPAHQPAPVAPKPNNPAVPPPSAPPASTPTTTAPPANTPAPPAPGQPTLTASGPSGSITLTPGAGPVDLPISVRNTGGSPSQPVTGTLHLPPGVSAVGGSQAPGSTHSASTQSAPAGRFAPAALGQNPAADSSPSSVPMSAGQTDCPGGTGTVTCSSSVGLQPGQSMVLLFRVEAAAGTTGGTITGTVSAGVSVSVDVSVQVTVPPVEQDALALTAHQDGDQQPWWFWQWDFYPVLDVTVTNTGTSTKPVTVDVDRTGVQTGGAPPAACLGLSLTTECRTVEALAPNQSLHLTLRLYGLHQGKDGHDTVTVTATLGSASRSVSTPVTSWVPPWPSNWQTGPPTWLWPWPPVAPPPTTTPTDPATTTEQPPTTTAPPTTTTRPAPPTITVPPVPTIPPRPTTTTPPVVPTTGPPAEPTTTTTVPPAPTCLGGGSGGILPGLNCGAISLGTG
ncbi:MAG TPA: sigma-70 family RNA polymerase sigma factor [Pseudonocardiaceae bacterium]|nr:sigma-70 family RNA polymerase sigma factor [Pseudonocardiaceae bacterium]